MPLDDAFQGSTDAALLDMVQRPVAPKPQAPAFSLWGFTTAAPKGVVAGAAQGIGSAADVTGAFGDVLGALGDAGGQGMFGGLTPDERKQTEQAREKLITEGPSYNTEAGRSFRQVAKDYMPDPVASHGAEQAVANFFRVGSKAVTAAATLGNIPGAIVAGAEEGFTQSDELGQQGVDLATRTKVGAVTAVSNAVGFALPAAGATWKSTVGLALAGGPVSFVAQNEATRQILKGANYSKLADQYDPFDPVGLALSTLLPLGFGALAMRGRTPKVKIDDDAVDAARVSLLRENIDHTRPVPVDDLAGSVAHSAAIGKAMDQMADGSRVDIIDVAPQHIAPEVITDAVAQRIKPLAQAFEEEVKLRQPPDVPRMSDAEVAPVAVKPKAPDAETPATAGRIKPESPELDRAAMEIEARSPDLMVQLDGMSEPARLSDLMARVREEASADAAEAPLIEAAANCFLRMAG